MGRLHQDTVLPGVFQKKPLLGIGRKLRLLLGGDADIKGAALLDHVSLQKVFVYCMLLREPEKQGAEA